MLIIREPPEMQVEHILPSHTLHAPHTPVVCV